MFTGNNNQDSYWNNFLSQGQTNIGSNSSVHNEESKSQNYNFNYESFCMQGDKSYRIQYNEQIVHHNAEPDPRFNHLQEANQQQMQTNPLTWNSADTASGCYEVPTTLQPNYGSYASHTPTVTSTYPNYIPTSTSTYGNYTEFATSAYESCTLPVTSTYGNCNPTTTTAYGNEIPSATSTYENPMEMSSYGNDIVRTTSTFGTSTPSSNSTYADSTVNSSYETYIPPTTSMLLNTTNQPMSTPVEYASEYTSRQHSFDFISHDNSSNNYSYSNYEYYNNNTTYGPQPRKRQRRIASSTSTFNEQQNILSPYEVVFRRNQLMRQQLAASIRELRIEERQLQLLENFVPSCVNHQNMILSRIFMLF
ncbi:cell wall protein DAN4-like [Teleopsis dalmanni]|uniref:cell wall protein DAN4-like n=1 Tax=Teleopsis dalmanni TaxID=139649 RepID=UPI0018CFEC2B|nr:cell wall protein DAN4-like [Teleopsis dalmanni]XP_037960067.1 cell wall protein DAN4-like [Teleopsis dalmanni]